MNPSCHNFEGALIGSKHLSPHLESLTCSGVNFLHGFDILSCPEIKTVSLTEGCIGGSLNHIELFEGGFFEMKGTTISNNLYLLLDGIVECKVEGKLDASMLQVTFSEINPIILYDLAFYKVTKIDDPNNPLFQGRKTSAQVFRVQSVKSPQNPWPTQDETERLKKALRQ